MRKAMAAAFLSMSLASACASMHVPASASTPAEVRVEAITRPAGETADWWYRAGARAARSRGAGNERARNLILFVGDGMSLTTVAAARIFEGQRRSQPGEENLLSFEEFPFTAFSKTYNTDRQTPDSAGTMSAMVTGAKTRSGVLSIGQQAERGDCARGRQAEMATLLELAEASGLSSGIVSTSRITHATPAATYAHSAERDWEDDADLPARASAAGCLDIARQFAEFDVGDGIDVALGGGRSNFLPADSPDPEYPGVFGKRNDGRNLVSDWQRRYPKAAFVWNKEQLGSLDTSRTDRLLGLFEPDHMRYEHERARDAAGEPSLAEMTRAAISILRRNRAGFFLMVEAGRIDHAHHAGNAFRALSDTVALSDAVRAATAMLDPSDTLILVTADHAHTLNFVGYPERGNPILGKVRGSVGEEGKSGLAQDSLGLPYTTLGYANGPGYAGPSDQQPEGPKAFPHRATGSKPASGRPNLREVDTEHPDYLQEAAMPTRSETHGGEDVGIWAWGSGASAVRGTLEQHTIFHVLLQAQPAIVRHLCRKGTCENGIPLAPLRQAR